MNEGKSIAQWRAGINLKLYVTEEDIKKAIAHLEKELEHQQSKNLNQFEYFKSHHASATQTTEQDGMALLYKQSDQEKN